MIAEGPKVHTTPPATATPTSPPRPRKIGVGSLRNLSRDCNHQREACSKCYIGDQKSEQILRDVLNGGKQPESSYDLLIYS